MENGGTGVEDRDREACPVNGTVPDTAPNRQRLRVGWDRRIDDELFVAQGDHGIDFHGTAGGDVAGRQSYEEEQRNYRSERR